jgi:hypothetical protein
MAARQYYYGEDLVESTTTDATNWTDQGTVTFTPDASTDYWVLWSIELQTGSTADDAELRVRETVGGTDLLTGYRFEAQENAAPVDYMSYGGVFRYQSGGSPSSITIALQFKTETGGQTAKAKNGRITVLKAAAGDEYAEVLTNSSTTGAAFADVVSLPFTPASAGDYLIIACAAVNHSVSTTQQARPRVFDGTSEYLNPGNTGQTVQDTTNFYNWGGAIYATGLSGSQTWKIQLSEPIGLGSTVNAINTAILALRLDNQRDSYISAQASDSQGNNATYTTTHTLTDTPQAGAHLILASFHINSFSTGASGYGQIVQDGSSKGEIVYESNSSGDRRVAFFAYVETLAAASTTWEIQRKTETTVQTTIYAGAIIAVIDLEAASSSTEFIYSPSGGMSLAGNATVEKSKISAVSGGLSLSGAATVAKGKIITPAGGISLAGSATITKEKIGAVSGGLTYAGSAGILKTKVFDPSGGVTFAGTATYSAEIGGATTFTYTPSGGMAFAGAATIAKDKISAVSGGVQFGGHAASSFTSAVVSTEGGIVPYPRRRRR